MGAADRSPINEPREQDWIDVLNATGSALADGTIVVFGGATGPIMKITPATTSNYVRGMHIVRGAIPNGARGRAIPWRHFTNVNTAGATIGDPVYLSGSGSWSLSGTVIVGCVTAVGASTGSIALFPQGVPGGGSAADSPFYLDVYACNVDTTDSLLSPVRAVSLVNGPYIEISATTVSSNGIVWPIPASNVTSLDIVYVTNDPAVDTLEFKLYEVERVYTAPAVVVAGSSDAHYDAAHDTNAERIAAGTHDLTLTPPTAVSRDVDKYLMLVMTFADADSLNGAIDVYSIRVNP